MVDSREIVLAGKTYKFTVPFTLGQALDVNAEISNDEAPENETRQARTKRLFRRTLCAVCAPLIEEHPELADIDQLIKTRGLTMREVNAAATIILSEAELIAKKDPAVGEAVAGAA